MSSEPVTEFQFRSVLGNFATGVAVIASVLDGRPVGMTIQSLCSLSLSPPMILICPSLTSTSWPSIAESRALCVNVLAEDQGSLARQFARSGSDKFASLEWKPSDLTGSPILPDCLAWIDCKIASIHSGGDHLVAVCDVLALGGRFDRRPLVFFKRKFTSVSNDIPWLSLAFSEF
jgi:flavin reductase (DIM6/NTAB) family NADH-FMN oxidoreductase RutF